MKYLSIILGIMLALASVTTTDNNTISSPTISGPEGGGPGWFCKKFPEFCGGDKDRDDREPRR